MNTIRFPGINLKLNISKTAFNFCGIKIYKYAICIIIGAAIGLLVAFINSKKIKLDFNEILEKFIYTFILGIIGARLYFVLFKFSYYKNNLLQILNLRDGGLAIYGGLILGATFLIISYSKNKEKLLNILDMCAPSVIIAQSIGRWGNFFNIEAYGYETKTFLRMGINTLNGYIEVHPTFLYESFACFIIFIILEIILYKRKIKGQVAITYCLLYSFIRFFIEGLRADSLMFLGFKISQIISIILFIISFVIIVLLSRKMSYEKQGKYWYFIDFAVTICYF